MSTVETETIVRVVRIKGAFGTFTVDLDGKIQKIDYEGEHNSCSYDYIGRFDVPGFIRKYGNVPDVIPFLAIASWNKAGNYLEAREVYQPGEKRIVGTDYVHVPPTDPQPSSSTVKTMVIQNREHLDTYMIDCPPGGKLLVDSTGKVLARMDGGNSNPLLESVESVNVMEFTSWRGQMDETELGLIGYWTHLNVYVPPDVAMRAAFSERVKASVDPTHDPAQVLSDAPVPGPNDTAIIQLPKEPDSGQTTEHQEYSGGNLLTSYAVPETFVVRTEDGDIIASGMTGIVRHMPPRMSTMEKYRTIRYFDVEHFLQTYGYIGDVSIRAIRVRRKDGTAVEPVVHPKTFAPLQPVEGTGEKTSTSNSSTRTRGVVRISTAGGMVVVDAADGQIVSTPSNWRSQPHYARIAKFNVAAYVTKCGFLPEAIPMADIGHWDFDNKYFPPISWTPSTSKAPQSSVSTWPPVRNTYSQTPTSTNFSPNRDSVTGEVVCSSTSRFEIERAVEAARKDLEKKNAPPDLEPIEIEVELTPTSRKDKKGANCADEAKNPVSLLNAAKTARKRSIGRILTLLEPLLRDSAFRENEGKGKMVQICAWRDLAPRKVACFDLSLIYGFTWGGVITTYDEEQGITWTTYTRLPLEDLLTIELVIQNNRQHLS